VEDVTLEELRGLVSGDEVALVDVRTPLEFEGTAGAHCDPRQGHIPGAVNIPLERILECRSAVEVRDLVGLPEGSEIVAYCHVGSRSRFAAEVLEGAGYHARNYVGSWHEWSRAVSDDAD
jgi:thiosulfate/3-mercaptopyruvate sulfurtransferase